MKRKASLLLSLLIAVQLAACGGDSGQTDTTTSGSGDTSDTTTSEMTEIEAELELPDKKYDYTVRVFMCDCEDVFPYLVSDLFVESSNGDVLNDAIYDRMATIAYIYGITFELHKSSNYNYETDALPVILAQEDAYDIIAALTPRRHTSISYRGRYSIGTRVFHMSILTSRGGISTRVRIRR